MRRQMRRHSTRRTSSSTSRRRLGHLFTRIRGHAPLLDPPGPTQITLGLHSYRTVSEPHVRAGFGDEVGLVSHSCCPGDTNPQPSMSESPLSSLSPQSVDSPEEELFRSRATHSEPPTPGQSAPLAHCAPALTPQEASAPPHPRVSRKLVLELAVNLKGVAVRRYSSLGPLSPVSPLVFPSSSQTPTAQPDLEPSLSPSDNDLTPEVPNREIKRARRREERNRSAREGLF